MVMFFLLALVLKLENFTKRLREAIINILLVFVLILVSAIILTALKKMLVVPLV
jgi:hypothetical protein